MNNDRPPRATRRLDLPREQGKPAPSQWTRRATDTTKVLSTPRLVVTVDRRTGGRLRGSASGIDESSMVDRSITDTGAAVTVTPR